MYSNKYLHKGQHGNHEEMCTFTTQINGGSNGRAVGEVQMDIHSNQFRVFAQEIVQWFHLLIVTVVNELQRPDILKYSSVPARKWRNKVSEQERP